MKDNPFQFTTSVIVLPFLFVLLLWIAFWVDIRFHLNLEEFGIYPRTLEGFRGVLFSPFIHGSLEHLYNNSIPLLILITALRFFYREQTFSVLGYGILLSGFLTWIIGRDSYHIGASGLVYVLVSFIFFKGIRTQYYRLVTLSLLVILIYGSLVWYIFPNVKEGISWEGHLAGLITGFIFAIQMKTPEYKKMIRYDWEHPDYNYEEDKFMQRFDENGNFVNLPPPTPEELEIHSHFNTSSNMNIIYDFIEKKDLNSNKN